MRLIEADFFRFFSGPKLLQRLGQACSLLRLLAHSRFRDLTIESSGRRVPDGLRWRRLAAESLVAAANWLRCVREALSLRSRPAKASWVFAPTASCSAAVLSQHSSSATRSALPHVAAARRCTIISFIR